MATHHFLLASTASSWSDPVNLNLAALLPTLWSLFHTDAILEEGHTLQVTSDQCVQPGAFWSAG